MKAVVRGVTCAAAVAAAVFSYTFIMPHKIEWRVVEVKEAAVVIVPKESPTAATSTTSSPMATTSTAVSTGDTRDEGWKSGIATVFWVGEDAGSDNGHIPNAMSAWDEEWQAHYGGVDDPSERCGFYPCAFTPKENPFYVALPYSDLDDNGRKKADAAQIPWNEPRVRSSVLKNRWIEVRVGGKSCFGQWQDVGPFKEDDFAYVFGTAPTPTNLIGEKAGIDLSPALADCLGVDGSDTVQWRHIEDIQVPKGDWKLIVTTRK